MRFVDADTCTVDICTTANPVVSTSSSSPPDGSATPHQATNTSPNPPRRPASSSSNAKAAFERSSQTIDDGWHHRDLVVSPT